MPQQSSDFALNPLRTRSCFEFTYHANIDLDNLNTNCLKQCNNLRGGYLLNWARAAPALPLLGLKSNRTAKTACALRLLLDLYQLREEVNRAWVWLSDSMNLWLALCATQSWENQVDWLASRILLSKVSWVKFLALNRTVYFELRANKLVVDVFCWIHNRKKAHTRTRKCVSFALRHTIVIAIVYLVLTLCTQRQASERYG